MKLQWLGAKPAISDTYRLANRPGMAGIVPELTHGVPCPGERLIMSRKCGNWPLATKQSCVCTEILINSYENAQKLLPPELLRLAQICTKSFVGWGFAPDPTGGAYSASQDPLAGLGGGEPRGNGRR